MAEKIPVSFEHSWRHVRKDIIYVYMYMYPGKLFVSHKHQRRVNIRISPMDDYRVAKQAGQFTMAIGCNIMIRENSEHTGNSSPALDYPANT